MNTEYEENPFGIFDTSLCLSICIYGDVFGFFHSERSPIGLSLYTLHKLSRNLTALEQVSALFSCLN